MSIGSDGDDGGLEDDEADEGEPEEGTSSVARGCTNAELISPIPTKKSTVTTLSTDPLSQYIQPARALYRTSNQITHKAPPLPNSDHVPIPPTYHQSQPPYSDPSGTIFSNLSHSHFHSHLDSKFSR